MGQLASEIENLVKYEKSKKNARAEKSKIISSISADDAKKSNLVKKALATQRAAFGAGGSTGKGMTDQAVLDRLRRETEEPFNEKRIKDLESLSKIKPVKKRNLLKSILSQFDSILK